MKLQKEKSRNYKNKKYFKFKINIPSKIIEEVGWKEGDELKIEFYKDKLILKK